MLMTDAHQNEIQEKPTVAAIYFPSWHKYPHADVWKSLGWTEWELVKQSRPKFQGHYQPLKPSWGYFDESQPEWAERQIDLAADHGIDVFLFDWYWYDSTQIMQDALEKGFLGASNRNRLKFALMWANHSWSDVFPAAPGKSATEMPCWLPQTHSLEDFKKVADYCIENYFNRENYWLVDGKLYFSFFSLESLRRDLGSVEKIREALKEFDERVKAAGLPGMHFNINIGSVGGLSMAWDLDLISRAEEAGFDSVFGYAIARAKFFATPDHPIFEYRDVMDTHEHLWYAADTKAHAFLPTISMGYDCTPRWDPTQQIPLPNLEYPHEPVIVGNTPELYGELCNRVFDFMKGSRTKNKIVFLNAWNEWTEGSYLLPEQQHGNAYLEALRDAVIANKLQASTQEKPALIS